jgi:hypothetical protein
MSPSGPPVRTAAPVVLGERPVFEHDSVPAPAPPASGWQTDFWAHRLPGIGSRLADSEMAALRELIGPPPAPPPTTDWGAVRERLGFGLPADYREFIDAYGPGTLGDIRITAPGAGGVWDLFALVEEKYRQVRHLPRTPGIDAPFYPEPGGLICWGETAGGLTCAWAPVRPDPEGWYGMIVPPRLLGFETQAGISFSAMLAEYVSDEPLGLIPRPEAMAGPVVFTPHRP